jgi:hypothetical protein
MSKETWFLVVLLMAVAAAAVARWRARLATGFQMAFLLRFQLLLVLFPVLTIVLSFVISGVAGNLINLDGEDSEWDAFCVAWAGFGSAYMSMALMTIVLDHAFERFFVTLTTPPYCVSFTTPHWFWTWKGILLFFLPPLGLMIRVYFASAGTVLLGMVFGMGVALVSVWLVELIFQWLEPPVDTGARSFPFPAWLFPDRVRRAIPMETKAATALGWLLRHLGHGYVRDDGRPYPEHVAATVAALLALVIYLLNFYLGWRHLSDGMGTTHVPTLAYLELLILAFALVLSGASFYLDRYRIPVIAALIAYTFVVSALSNTDHYWLAIPLASSAKNDAGQRPDFPDGVGKWLNKYSGGDSDKVLRVDGKPVLVVVCASGGGIEAAAWTAKVLTELQNKFGPRFARSIRLISSTSGGSVGSLFYVESFFTAKDAPGDPQRIVNAAENPSLDATGWGFVHPDFARLMAPALLPFLLGGDREIDRGWALDQALRVALKDPGKRSIDTRLSQWREAVNDGWLPGTVFNATLVESGNPLLLSTIHVPLPPIGSKTVVFGDTDDRGADISAVTAARLSASFPFVSPVTRERYVGAKRRKRPALDIHVADGGYYDNYGVTVAVEWLNDIMKKYPGKFGKVIIVEIDAFPEEKKGDPRSRIYCPPPSSGSKSMGGWTSEFLGPLKSVLNARTSTQLGRDIIELELLKNWNGPSNAPSCSPACPLINTFRFVAEHEGPLSWQLSRKEKACVDEDWKAQDVQDQVECLRQCVG